MIALINEKSKGNDVRVVLMLYGIKIERLLQSRKAGNEAYFDDIGTNSSNLVLALPANEALGLEFAQRAVGGLKS